MAVLFEDDFKAFKDVKEARQYYNGIVLDTLKKFFGCKTDFTLSCHLGIQQANLAHVRAGDRSLSFRYIKDIQFDECTRLLIQNSYSLSICCPLLFDKN